MIQLSKISFLFLIFFISSCDDDKESSCSDIDSDQICDVDEIQGCTNEDACNFNIDATDDDESCLLNIFCYDADGDQMGYGDSTQICLDEIPQGWIVDCSDDTDDCAGVRDDCGECNGNNESMDCENVCFGTGVIDDFNTCCDNTQIQPLSFPADIEINFDICLPQLFKWSLIMTGTVGEYDENNIFIVPSDSISNSFTIGTHYLSTDGLDILEDMSYSDIVKPPSTVENSIYFYTSHPEWEYSFGNDFIQEYKFHNLDKIASNSGISPGSQTFEGISWDGNMTSDYYGEKFIKLSFSLESEQYIYSDIKLSFNDEVMVYSADCEGQLFFSNTPNNNDIPNEECNLIGEDFEYIIPIIFQGTGYLMPFSILIGNTFIQ